MSEPFEDLEPSFEETFRLCFCGCPKTNHRWDGSCMYCFSEDCPGFEYDEESTIMALCEPPPDVP